MICERCSQRTCRSRAVRHAACTTSTSRPEQRRRGALVQQPCRARPGRQLSATQALGPVLGTLPSAQSKQQEQAPAVDLPKHWEDQLKRAPVGKRRVLQRYCVLVKEVNALEEQMVALRDEELQAKTGEFKARLAAGQEVGELLVEAFAVVRETSRRVLGLRHFDSQLLGGMVLHDGQIAEMQTGEGKTLMAALPIYLNALAGRGVHVITVNDYLAARDAEWMGKIYRFLGLTCGAVQTDMTVQQYQAAYHCDITYVTGQELCFDYLRDNTAHSASELVLPEQLAYAVVDEVDSILIDESRNPMIVSTPVHQSEAVVRTVDAAVKALLATIDAQFQSISAGLRVPVPQVRERVRGRYLVVDKKQKALSLTKEGMQALVEALVQQGVVFRRVGEGGGALAPSPVGQRLDPMNLWEDEVPWGQLALNSLKAHEFYKAGEQYIVREGKVVIIDESTGRVRPSSRYQGGIHQAIEAKEGVAVKQETVATSSITFQVFFRFYDKLAGMTGTASTAAAEFYEIYALRVVQIPTARPSIRRDLPPMLYLSREDKYQELANLVQNCWAADRPVLIGTTSVNESEEVRRALLEFCRHEWQGHAASRVQVLNARPENVRTEAQTVAQAGLPGQVTIATNMAGRGTDIILGGNPEGLTKLGLMRLLYKRLLADQAEAESIPRMPLGVFEAYDAFWLGRPMDWTPEGTAQGDTLPRDLHFVLYQAMLLMRVDAQRERCSYDEVERMAAAAVDMAERVRREVVRRLEREHPGARLEDLGYTQVVCPVAKAVLADMEPLFLQETPGQQLAVRAAVHLWLWLDQQCAGFARRVRRAGGLLVVGTSVQESQRIELQLRGRSGRQGDPGTTVMLCDATDPLLSTFGLATLQRVVAGVQGVYIDGLPVEICVREVQRLVENTWQMARLETKRYDEIMEDYRRNLYTLRGVILKGTPQQRTQLLFMFLQLWLDRLVATRLDPQQGPAQWLQPPPAGGTGGGAGGLAEAAGASGRSALEEVLAGVQQLVNPDGVVSKTLVEFRTVGKGGTARDTTLANMLKFLGLGGGAAGPSGPGSNGTGSTSGLPQSAAAGIPRRLPVQILEIPVLSEPEISSLARYLLEDAPLPWVTPRVPLTLSLKTALSRHRRIFGSSRLRRGAGGEAGGDAGPSGSGGGASREWTGGVRPASRPPVEGRYAEKVEVVRDWLGEALLLAYELRKASLKQALLANQGNMLDLDADIHLALYEQHLMLDWMDALWSAFLEDMERVRRAVQVKSFGNLSPLEEFRLEANRSFLVMLDCYREAVVEKLFAPSFEFDVLGE